MIGDRVAAFVERFRRDSGSRRPAVLPAASRAPLREAVERSEALVNPRLAKIMAQRRRARRQGSSGGWAAGVPTRLDADLPTQPVPVESFIRQQLGTLRARSRHAGQNHPFGRRFLHMQESHVVGPRGIRFQARINGLDGEPDRNLNRAVEEAFTEWGEAENCDVEGLRSWRQMQAAFIRSCAEDGELLVRKWRGDQFGPYGFQLQVLDPELLDRNYNRDLPTGKVRMGIEYNEFSRPIAYHLLDAPDPLLSVGTYVGGRHVRVDAGDMIHRFLPERAGQRRGVPWMSTVLKRMGMFEGMEFAALVASRQGAARPAFVEEGETPYSGTGVEEGGEDGEGGKEIEVQPGILEFLAHGSQVHTVDWPYPSEVYAPFQKAMALSMATGLLASYAGLTGDLTGVNYSSIRAGRLDELDVWRILQWWEAEAFCLPVYKDWAAMGVLSGTIEAAPGIGVSANRLRAIQRGAKWRPRRWEWVDPLKDAQAWEKAIRNGWASISMVIRERGDDPEEVWEELRRDLENLEELGLTLKDLTTALKAAA